MRYRTCRMRYRMRHRICRMRYRICRKLKKILKRYDCISPAGLKISLTCFVTSFASGFFVSTVFFVFAQKRNEKGGWDGSLRCFFTTFASGYLVKIIFVVFAQKRNGKGDWNDSLTCFFQYIKDQRQQNSAGARQKILSLSHTKNGCRSPG